MKFIFTFILFCLTHTLWSCSCIYIPSFCETLPYYENAIVIRGKIVSNNNKKEMDVKVEEVLLGSIDQANVTIQSGNGADCGEFTENFKKGETYILIINGNQISTCGITYLKIVDEIVEGPIREDLKRISYDSFLTLPECGSLNQGLYSIGVFPNPFAENISLTSNFQESKKVEFKVFDMVGRVILSGNEVLHPGKKKTKIDAHNIITGVYILELTTIQTKRQIRIIKG